MEPLFKLIVILLVPLLLFLIHAFRDIRGKNRNNHGCCYACGRSESILIPVAHFKSEMFFYCSACAKKQGLFKGILLLITALAISTTLAVKGIATIESQHTDGIILLAIAASIIAFLIFVLVVYVRRMYK